MARESATCIDWDYGIGDPMTDGYEDRHDERLWKKWLPWFIENSGVPERQARAMVGKLRKTWEDVYINAAFADAKEAMVADPYPYVLRLLESEPTKSENFRAAEHRRKRKYQGPITIGQILNQARRR